MSTEFKLTNFSVVSFISISVTFSVAGSCRLFSSNILFIGSGFEDTLFSPTSQVPNVCMFHSLSLSLDSFALMCNLQQYWENQKNSTSKVSLWIFMPKAIITNQTCKTSNWWNYFSGSLHCVHTVWRVGEEWLGLKAHTPILPCAQQYSKILLNCNVTGFTYGEDRNRGTWDVGAQGLTT